MKGRFIATLLLVILAVEMSDAIECFECSNIDLRASLDPDLVEFIHTITGNPMNSTVTTKCNDPFNRTNTELKVNCPGVCMKNKGDTGFIWRFCVPKATTCFEESKEDLTKSGVDYCCEGDSCNNAEAASYSMLMSTLIIAFTFFFLR